MAAFEAAKRAKDAGLDLQVTIVEAQQLGGTCLNSGCIPTKTILRTAHALTDITRAAEFALSGVDTTLLQVDLEALRARKDSVVDNLVQQVQASARRLGVQVIQGRGTLVSNSPLKIAVHPTEGSEKTEDAECVLDCDALIIATGSLPLRLPALDQPFVWTSDHALALTQIPESIIIVGGGVIGVEFASAYAAFGSQVTVVELAATLLPGIDKRVSKALAREFKKQGIDLHLADSLAAAEQNADGGVTATLASGTQLTADVIMSAVGRVPNTADCGFEQAGIAFAGRAIAVDNNYQTNLDGVYAIGDVIGGMMLAHEAEHEGVAAAAAIVDGWSNSATKGSTPARHACDGNLIPGCIYTSPEVATIGLSVDAAREAGIATVTGIAKYAANGKALAEGEGEGFVQIVADADSGTLLGAQIVGAKAVELIAVFIPYVAGRRPVSDIAQAVFAHPTLSEVIKAAAEMTQAQLRT